jgi:peptidoglycan hydrolase-like protein with peptidoglycan-binding domain
MVAAAIAATFALVSPGAGHGGAARASETRAKHGSASSPGRPVLRVVSMLPSDRAARVNGSGPIEVAFSARLAASSPLPTLTPPVRGRWQQVGTAMVFTPAAGFAPLTKVTVRIPAGQAGVRSAAGALLARPLAWHFSTRSYSQLRLSELLSQLGYLPISWTPAASGHLAGPEGTAGGGPASPASLAYSPPAGKFTWDKGYPSMLTSQWRPGAPNPVATGALMAFESQHGMPADGVASPALWAALFRTAARRQGNRAGYTYAIASQSLPEMLTIWHDGKVVMRSLANTGIPVAPTADGTFPVYLRYRFQIMSGINPDGSHYSDPVSFVAYFNGGDAVHYFPRGSYGYQQSLGCVELPLSSAAQAWPYLTYGSLVTVAS